MTKPIVVANWKNHPGSLAEAKTLLSRLAKNRLLYKKLSFFIAPPLPYFELISRRSKNFAHLASQDISSISQGTHTGVVTPEILKSFGVKLAILGHSERRALGETNEDVSRKVKIALHSSLAPLVCVGELSRDSDGEHFEFLRNQLKLSLAGLSKRSNVSKLAIAYEPVWAIGRRAKDAIKADGLTQAVIFIRKVLTDLFGRATAQRIPILYGGSVEPSNSGELMRETRIRGFLVGHASLSADSFREIAQSLITK